MISHPLNPAELQRGTIHELRSGDQPHQRAFVGWVVTIRHRLRQASDGLRAKVDSLGTEWGALEDLRDKGGRQDLHADQSRDASAEKMMSK